MKYILSIDQGTTGSTALLLNSELEVVSRGYCEVVQHYPEPGWVSHDPEQIFDSVNQAVKAAMASAGATAEDISGIGITNQRETTVLWDRATGKPVHHAIVWQCRRSQSVTQGWKDRGLELEVQKRTGLLLDPYFSASKITWLLENVEGLRARCEAGEICFGTIDSYLIFRLTGQHCTEPSNASRTMLYNLSGEWDSWLLQQFNIPASILPKVVASGGEFGLTHPDWLGCPIPIGGVLGDQQASLFGQACFQPGQLKTTYGTGCFLMMNTGDHPVPSQYRLLTTVAWQLPGHDKLTYALEGSVFSAGSAIQWLRDNMGFFPMSSHSQALAESVSDSQGVRFIPAFTGLGAPYWNSDIRAALLGVTRGTMPAHVTRAVLEAVAFQTTEVVELMRAELETVAPDFATGMTSLRVDGGMVANSLLMQLQADLLGIPVDVPACQEATAFGAGCMAALGLGWFDSMEELASKRRCANLYHPKADNREAARHDYEDWKRLLKCLL